MTGYQYEQIKDALADWRQGKLLDGAFIFFVSAVFDPELPIELSCLKKRLSLAKNDEELDALLGRRVKQTRGP